VTITDSGKKVVVRTVSTNDDGEFSAPLRLSLAMTSLWRRQTLHVDNGVKVNVNERRGGRDFGAR
jgi:hypothetical protein